jgi:hypothetical protein
MKVNLLFCQPNRTRQMSVCTFGFGGTSTFISRVFLKVFGDAQRQWKRA